METREHLEKQIERMTRELGRMSHEEPWASEMMYLMQIPGFGVVTGMTDPGSHWRDHPFRDPESTGQLFWADTWAGTEWSEAAWQEHHEGRTEGTALGDGGSGLAGSESDPHWKKLLRGTATAHAQESGNRGDRPASADRGLVCADPA